jgi:hypothetical protein
LKSGDAAPSQGGDDQPSLEKKREQEREDTKENSSSPPAGGGVSQAADEGKLTTLLAAWNRSDRHRSPYQAAEPPPKVRERLAEPGWLHDALKAIEKIDSGACRRFSTPVTLAQLADRSATKGTFVARILGGEFDAEDRPTKTKSQPGPRRGNL